MFGYVEQGQYFPCGGAPAQVQSINSVVVLTKSKGLLSAVAVVYYTC